MKIAIPTANGKLAMHFGHCEKFTIVNVKNNKVVSIDDAVPPPHEPDVLPKWLGEQNVNVIIAGGMGIRAQNLFETNNIKVIVGAPADSVDNLVAAFLDNSLETGDNACNH